MSKRYTKVFDKKEFLLVGNFTTKPLAKSEAKRLRKAGHSSRVTQTRCGGLTNNFVWVDYHRKRRNKK